MKKPSIFFDEFKLAVVATLLSIYPSGCGKQESHSIRSPSDRDSSESSLDSETAMAVVGSGKPPLDGTFMFLGDANFYNPIPSGKVAAYLDDLRSIGMKTVVIANTVYELYGCGSGVFAYRPELPSKLTTILAEAQKRSMQVFVGLVFSIDACQASKTGYATSESNIIQVTKRSEELVVEFDKLLGGFPSLAGYYVPDEPQFDLSKWTFNYHKKLIPAIKAKTKKPILVAPFFKTTTSSGSWLSPDQLAQVAKDFVDTTGVDYVALQDSFGADTSPNISWNRYGFNLVPYSSQDYLTKFVGKIGASRAWVDIELFNGGTSDYSGATIARINHQIYQARESGVGKTLSWISQRFITDFDSNYIDKASAARGKAEFQAIYGLNSKLRHVANPQYQWLSVPHASYRDSGKELFNGVPGDRLNFYDPSWSGVLGSASVRVQFGATTQKIPRYVSAQLLAHPVAGIYLPTKMTVVCYDGKRNTTLVAESLPATVTNADGEYSFGNSKPLPEKKCIHLDIHWDNKGRWTFIGELNIVERVGL